MPRWYWTPKLLSTSENKFDSNSRGGSGVPLPSGDVKGMGPSIASWSLVRDASYIFVNDEGNTYESVRYIDCFEVINLKQERRCDQLLTNKAYPKLSTNCTPLSPLSTLVNISLFNASSPKVKLTMMITNK